MWFSISIGIKQIIISKCMLYRCIYIKTTFKPSCFHFNSTEMHTYHPFRYPIISQLKIYVNNFKIVAQIKQGPRTQEWGIILKYVMSLRNLLIFSSPERKVKVSFSDHLFSVVCSQVSLKIFHIFDLLYRIFFLNYLSKNYNAAI